MNWFLLVLKPYEDKRDNQEARLFLMMDIHNRMQFVYNCIRPDNLGDLTDIAALSRLFFTNKII